MAKVENCVETLPKISIAWVGCTNVTDDGRTGDSLRRCVIMGLWLPRRIEY